MSAKAAAKTKAAPSHPKFSVMITSAIAALKERAGSSRQAIRKYIMANYGVDADQSKGHFGLAVKRMVAKGHLVAVKASFKLSDAAKAGTKKKSKAPKAAAAPAAAAPKKAAPKKKAAAAKPKAAAAKKAPAAKTAAPKKAAAAKKAPASKKAAPKKAAAKK